MKKDWSKILAGASCILLVICLVQIGSLKREIQNLQNNLGSRISDVEYSVNNISSSVYQQLEREASLVTNTEWIYGEMDLENYTILLHCTVSPKEYQPGVTEAVLISCQTEYPMILENGVYTADIQIPLFEETRIDQVQFREDGTVRTELLDWYLSPREQGVMNVYMDFAGGTSFGKEGDQFVLEMDGTVNLYTERKGDRFEIETVYLVEQIDEKESTREEIQVQQNSAMEYEFQIHKRVRGSHFLKIYGNLFSVLTIK